MPRPHLAVPLALAALAAGATGARAQQPMPSALAEMARCRGVAEVEARARCYDAAWDALEQARAKKRLVIMEEEDVRRTRRGLFGFGGLRLPLIGGEEDAPATLETTVTSASEIGAGRYQFSVGEGAVWQTVEPPRDSYLPRTGSKVVIRRGAIGNYFARFGSSSSTVRAKRVR